MNEKTLRVLEFNKIIALLTSEAVSPMAKAILEELKPVAEHREISEMLTETSEAVSVIMRKGNLPFGDLYDIKKNVRYAEKGGVLSMKQLLEVSYDIRAARNTRTFLKSDASDIPVIWGMAEILNVNKKLEDHIDGCILSENDMADNASSLLKSIRRNIVQQKEAVRAKMNSILSSSQNRELLQDNLFTIRDGRFVIPVKQEHKSKFPGIVHDRSATGATVFIEPQAIVTMNNELRELEINEQIEIQRILAELSSEVGEKARDLINNQKLLTMLDVIFAKGKLAVKQHALPAEINEKGFLNIRNGRHPLIDPDTVVPVSITIGKNYNTLVITGPNTGGKTVTLKTVGLMLLMNQCGLHVPAGAGTELPIMKKIFADIGDEQSIEQSLSTFSSHMNNIVDIIKFADDNAFVILDELGAGTDPTEGAALGIAILNHLYKKGAKTLATTHYNELKKYAIATEGVENASMEFDVATLSPTYRLTIGTPGRSNAFEISRKLGLPLEIIDRARSMLGRDDIQFEEVIAKIEKDKIAAENERDEAIQLKLKLKKQSDEIDTYQEKLEKNKRLIIEEAREKAAEIVEDAKEFADEIKRELREMNNSAFEAAGADTDRKQQEIRKKLKEQSLKYKDKIEPIVNVAPVKRGELKLGDRVKVVSLDQKGSVISLPDDRDEVLVQVGLLKINAKLEDITKIKENNVKTNFKKTKYGALYKQKSSSVSMSINVIGKSLDEAVMDVDKYLDDAFMSGLKQVTVIHGRGEGILRNGLHDLFKRHKHVSEYQSGSYYEGGEGVTIVTLK